MEQDATPATDVLLVLGHGLHVRNAVGGGLVDMLHGRGLRTALIAPRGARAGIARMLRDLATVYDLDDVPTTRRRRRLLEFLRLGAYTGRRDAFEYRKRLEWAARRGIVRRAQLAAWRAVDRVRPGEYVATAVMQRLRPRRAARALVDRIDPAVVLWPTTIADPVDFDVMKAVSDRGVPILMCEGSWDNLVSKGPIWPRPDRILVWGDHSRRYALEHHGFTDDQVAVTGPPHFDIYGQRESLATRDEWFARHGLDPARRLILIGGGTVGRRSEPYIIPLLSRWIDGGLLPPSYIWYRPHPRIRARGTFDPESLAHLPHVVMDWGLKFAGSDAAGPWKVHQEEARQRAEVISACDVMVSPFSTIVVEAALLGKPSILVLFSPADDTGPAEPSRFGDFAHVRYLAECPWIFSAHSGDDVLGYLRKLLDLDLGDARAELHRFGLSLAHCGDGRARERIVDAVEEMRQSRGTRRGGTPRARVTRS